MRLIEISRAECEFGGGRPRRADGPGAAGHQLRRGWSPCRRSRGPGLSVTILEVP